MNVARRPGGARPAGPGETPGIAGAGIRLEGTPRTHGGGT